MKKTFPAFLFTWLSLASYAAYAADEIYMVMVNDEEAFFIDSGKIFPYGAGSKKAVVYKASGNSLEGEIVTLDIDCTNKSLREILRHIYVFADEEGATTTDREFVPFSSNQKALDQDQINEIASVVCSGFNTAKKLPRVENVPVDPKLRLLALSHAAANAIRNKK